MNLITILLTDETQLQCSVGSWKETLDFVFMLEEHKGILKYKVSDSEKNLFCQRDHYFEGSEKWVENFYEYSPKTELKLRTGYSSALEMDWSENLNTGI